MFPSKRHGRNSILPQGSGLTTQTHRRIALALVTAAVLALIWFWWTRTAVAFDWSLFRRTFLGLDLTWLSLSIACAFATYYGRALRWAVLLRPLKPKPSISNLFRCTIIGFTAIVILGRPGEFVRPYLIAVKEQVPVGSQFAAWLLERIYDLLIALLIFAFALSQVDRSSARVGPALAWVLSTGGTVALFASLICLSVLIALRNFAPALGRRLLDALAFLNPNQLDGVRRLVDAFVAGAESTRSASAVSQLVAYTVLEWLLIAACYFTLLRSFGSVFVAGWLDVLILMGFIAFGAVVQLPGVGGGVLVVTVVVLKELFSVPLEVA
ncbi:MAG: lysylphosphatidylglycerol synthase transmembrane domain-containing protein, partial [Bryobacteraceae bacterium]